ncbi:MAG: response regulator [Pseudomonadota bacterium]
MTEIPEQKYVLIIDDDEEDVFAFKWAMKYSLPEVSIVHIDDGAKAVDFLLNQPPADNLPVLILVDINMPGVDGYDTLIAIRNSVTMRHLPVLMFSTSGSPAEVRRSYAEGANAHLVKPTSIAELRELAVSVSDFWLKSVALPDGSVR